MQNQTLIFRDKHALVTKYIHQADVVLDVGFWGQGITENNPQWIHELLCTASETVYGTDLQYDESATRIRANPSRYRKANAESFDFDGMQFDTIVASELIEHLSNPGMFLDSCKKYLKPGGMLILTTPNCFNLFNIAGKLSRKEPVTNADHTCYYNSVTLIHLLEKNGWVAKEVAYVYTLNIDYPESFKKKVLNAFYKLFSIATPKFLETLVIVAEQKNVTKLQ
jgi:SAM-dependent methyltransferase